MTSQVAQSCELLPATAPVTGIPVLSLLFQVLWLLLLSFTSVVLNCKAPPDSLLGAGSGFTGAITAAPPLEAHDLDQRWGRGVYSGVAIQGLQEDMTTGCRV